MVSLLGTRDELLKLIEAAFEEHRASSAATRSPSPASRPTPNGSPASSRSSSPILERGRRPHRRHRRPLHRHHPRRRAPGRPSEVFGDSVLTSRGHHHQATVGRKRRSTPPKSPRRPLHQAQDGRPGKGSTSYAIRKNTVVFRHRPRRHRQDLPGHGRRRPGPHGQAGQPPDPHPPGRRGRREARLPPRHPLGEDRPLPAPPLRRPLRDDRRRADRPHDGTRHDRGRPLAYMRGGRSLSTAGPGPGWVPADRRCRSATS